MQIQVSFTEIENPKNPRIRPTRIAHSYEFPRKAAAKLENDEIRIDIHV